MAVPDLTTVTRAIARYRARRSILRISRFPPHLLYDLGFDPDAVYEAGQKLDWRGMEKARR